MRLARKAGIDVPGTFLLPHPDPRLAISHFCIERFDLGDRGKKTVMEFASLMGLDSKNKYSAQTEDLFQSAESVLDADNLKNLANAYFYGILTGNGDMHTKNFSIFVENDSSYRLTPIYDMVNTQIHDFPNMLALPMNESCNPNPSMRSVVDFLRTYTSAKDMARITQAVKSNLSKVLDLAFPQERKPANTLERERDGFRRRLENSILSRATEIEKTLERAQI